MVSADESASAVITIQIKLEKTACLWLFSNFANCFPPKIELQLWYKSFYCKYIVTFICASFDIIINKLLYNVHIYIKLQSILQQICK